MLQITPLNDTKGKSYVLVIDDISEVTQAQRHSAWGEVARRLAHEIKNPLTRRISFNDSLMSCSSSTINEFILAIKIICFLF